MVAHINLIAAAVAVCCGIDARNDLSAESCLVSDQQELLQTLLDCSFEKASRASDFLTNPPPRINNDLNSLKNNLFGTDPIDGWTPAQWIQARFTGGRQFPGGTYPQNTDNDRKYLGVIAMQDKKEPGAALNPNDVVSIESL